MVIEQRGWRPGEPLLGWCSFTIPPSKIFGIFDFTSLEVVVASV